MDIQFDTEEIRQLCTSKTIAERKFSELVALQLQSRLSDLRAISNISELPVGLKKTIEGKLGQTRVIDLTNGHEMIFDANHRQQPLGSNGLINWEMVDRIKIIAIKGFNS